MGIQKSNCKEELALAYLWTRRSIDKRGNKSVPFSIRVLEEEYSQSQDEPGLDWARGEGLGKVEISNFVTKFHTHPYPFLL